MSKPVGCVVAMLLCLCAVRRVDGAVEGFDESFDGNGPYATISQVLAGLDNPNWRLLVDGDPLSLDGEGYTWEHAINNGFVWIRNIMRNGSYRQSVKLSHLDMGWLVDPSIGLDVSLSPGLRLSGAGFSSYLGLIYDATRPEEKLLDWGFSTPQGAIHDKVPLSSELEVGLEANFEQSVAWAWIESPATGRMVKGPLTFEPIDNPAFIDVRFGAAALGPSDISGRLDNWSLEPLPDIRADINDDGVLNVADVDLLSLIIRRNGVDAVADLSIDGKVDQTDLGLWIHEHRKTYFGDANLDGQFNSQDLTLVFQAGDYEDLIEDNSGWADGDWNADGEFSSSDLVVAFQDGGYEKVAAVPEPAGLVAPLAGWIVVGCSGQTSSRRKQQRRWMRRLACMVVMILASRSGVANDSFVESFSGEGPYVALEGEHVGLDTPGWSFGGEGGLRDGGYAFDVAPHSDSAKVELIARNLTDSCSFKERVELKNFFQGPVDPNGLPSTTSQFALAHPVKAARGLLIGLYESNEDVGSVRVTVQSNETVVSDTVPTGSDIAFEIRYRKETRQATLVYDNDTHDDNPGYLFGPFSNSPLNSGQSTFLSIIAGGAAEISGVLDSWTYVSLCESYADFNQDGSLGVGDIDQLSEEVRNRTNDATLDLNGDSFVNNDDRLLWVQDFRNTFFGDSNLDGQFNSTDLALVFQSGEYDDPLVGTSTWATGDWSGDGEFDSRDLVIAFQDGGYEQGPRAARGVPEPSVASTLALLLFAGGDARRRRHA